MPFALASPHHDGHGRDRTHRILLHDDHGHVRSRRILFHDDHGHVMAQKLIITVKDEETLQKGLQEAEKVIARVEPGVTITEKAKKPKNNYVVANTQDGNDVNPLLQKFCA